VSALEVTRLHKNFGKLPALRDVSFVVKEGEFFVILGPTNAGKSTLLKTIAGLIRPDAGQVRIKERPVTEAAPKDRNVSLLFQNIALFPTMTGFENIAFPLRTAGVPEEETRRRVQAVAVLLKVEHILHRLPRTFSGGEQQRTAIGRAIIHRTDLLLLDEPLSNLDARIRISLRLEFKRIHRDGGQSIAYVTHDQVEAMSLADRVGVLSSGRFEQIGTPQDVYQRPANRFVADFVGTPSMNILECELEGDGGNAPRFRGSGFDLKAPFELPTLRDAIPNRLALGVRPEEVRVGPTTSADTPFWGEVLACEHVGAKRVLDIKLGENSLKALVAREHAVAQGQPVSIGFDVRAHRLLDPRTDRFLR